MAAGAGFLENFLEIVDPGEDRRGLDEMQLGVLSQQPGNRGFSRTRRPPKNQAAQRTRFDQPGQRAIGAKQMVLSGDFAEVMRAQPFSEGTRRVPFQSSGGK